MQDLRIRIVIKTLTRVLAGADSARSWPEDRDPEIQAPAAPAQHRTGPDRTLETTPLRDSHINRRIVALT
jgi:hypothetical protein